MKAIYYEEFQQKPRLEEVPDPVPSDQGVVLKVGASGICRSDWHGWMGHDPDIRLPHVPGHELVGEIVEVGKEVSAFRKGERVTLPFVCGCGTCSICNSGNPQVCDFQFQPGFTHWGSFAEYVAIEYADFNLVRVPESISDIHAASLGCRFITAFRAIADLAKVSDGQLVVVHGCGGVGLSAIMIARALGAEVVAVDIKPEALRMAKNCGAHHLVNAGNTDVIHAVFSIRGEGADVSMDALGSRETCNNSIKCLKKLGTHLQVGLLAGDDYEPEIPMHLVIAKELKLLGSHGMQATRYPQIFQMIEAGSIDPGILVTGTVDLKGSIEHLIGMDNHEHSGITVIV